MGIIQYLCNFASTYTYTMGLFYLTNYDQKDRMTPYDTISCVSRSDQRGRGGN